MPPADEERRDGEIRELTLDDALEVAVRAHRSENFPLAESLYRRILEAAPDQPDALHFLGILHHRTRRSPEAVRLIQRAIAIAPEVPSMHVNLGNILFDLDRPDLAQQAFSRATELDPGHVEAHNNLGVVLRALRQPDEAEAAYREALAVAPDYREAWDNLGRLLGARGRVEESIDCHIRALELQPRDDTRRLLIAANAATGRTEKALGYVREWLAAEPENPTARHLEAALTGENVPARAADRYVASMFDDFAASFDHKLAQLDYRAPALVAAAVAAVRPAPTGDLAVLDAGCGTGLCGPALRPYAARLEGVDLSGGMLAKAERRGGYDGLERAELTAFLEEHPAAYDLVVSADTLCYFGDLAPVCAAASAALKPGGHLVFTVEADDEGRDVHLQAHGRYCHGRTYVERALAEAGLSVVAIGREGLRVEGGKPVTGWVVTAAKAG